MDIGRMRLRGGKNLSSPPQPTHTKKKRRHNCTNSTAPRTFIPPPLTGSGDTVIASNPFDDVPQRGLNSAMPNDVSQMPPPPPHLAHHLADSQMREMSPMEAANINAMMNRMENSAMRAHMNHMGPPQNHPSMGNMNSMGGMRSNMSQCQVSTRNNHMNMTVGHMTTMQLNDSMVNNGMNGTMNNSRRSPATNLNHGLGSPMSGSLGPSGRPMNSASPNDMSNGSMNFPGVNGLNNTNLLNSNESSLNEMTHLRCALTRPQGRPRSGVNSGVPPGMMGNLNMGRAHMNNMQNINLNNAHRCNHPDCVDNSLNNICNGAPIHNVNHGMNIGRVMSPQGLCCPPPHRSNPMIMTMPKEKIFPPDQPLIFNHQNPNAPPISPCGICRKEVQANDQAILCESGCNFWFHRRCAGLTEIAYNLLMYEAYAEWACDKCLQTKNVPLVKIKP